MNLSVKELQLGDAESVVDYFHKADVDFLKGMGADKNKLPKRDVLIEKLKIESQKPYSQKELYYIIWFADDQAVGHSNANNIKYGESATMHLHLWKSENRQRGLGLDLMRLTIPLYFKKLDLESLFCEPYSKNVAPNKTLIKLGFELIRTYETTPGLINYKQIVNHYEFRKSQLHDLY